MHEIKPANRVSPLPLHILKAGLLVGTLDIAAACLYYAVKTGRQPPWPVLQYIASGLFGPAAFGGGMPTMLAGLFLHYCIAFAFTAFFYRGVGRLRRYVGNKIWLDVAYGLLIWAGMNLVVVPLSNAPPQPFAVGDALLNAVILIVCVGIPRAVRAHPLNQPTKAAHQQG
ncbi:MAG: hypothetical protein ICV83_18490 [Cytophagales bacterium]|nr:hypothetical protein [Cytophagales bacterium]